MPNSIRKLSSIASNKILARYTESPVNHNRLEAQVRLVVVVGNKEKPARYLHLDVVHTRKGNAILDSHIFPPKLSGPTAVDEIKFWMKQTQIWGGRGGPGNRPAPLVCSYSTNIEEFEIAPDNHLTLRSCQYLYQTLRTGVKSDDPLVRSLWEMAVKRLFAVLETHNRGFYWGVGSATAHSLKNPTYLLT